MFAGIALLAVSADSLLFADLAQQSLPAAAVFLLLAGFGIKLALPGLHLWLPLTYRLAPAAAVAVLSGPMMKAGLVGWMRFLPPGAPGLDAWGMPLLILGSLGVVLGVLLGVLQHKPRAVLAYSSVAKMGLVSAVYGIALRHPTLAESLVPALLLFAVHHLLVKAALFLGVDLFERGGARRPLLIALGVLAAVLAAAPFSAGFAAKSALGAALHGELTLLMVLSAIGTAWLMIRFMVVLAGTPSTPVALSLPAALGFAAIGVLSLSAPFSPASLGFESSSLYPLVLAALSALAARGLVVRTAQAMPRPGLLWEQASGCWLPCVTGQAGRCRHFRCRSPGYAPCSTARRLRSIRPGPAAVSGGWQCWEAWRCSAWLSTECVTEIVHATFKEYALPVGRRRIPGCFTGNTAEEMLQTIPASVLAVRPRGFVSPLA